jgi:transposase-like protein/Zn ribbon nucleic-acid-binding protein
MSLMKKPNRLKRKRIMTVSEFRSRFGDETQCAQHLTAQRWPNGFVCPRCQGGSRGYMASRRVHECAACGYQGSVTAGTIFHKTRTPLTSWFWAIYRMSQDKKGISALQLSKEINVSYPTAWLMQHKIRKAMADRDQGYRLQGLIEVDEGYVGGAEEGKAQKGRGAKSKSVVAVAVERRAPSPEGDKPIPGFAAMAVVPNAAASSLVGFLQTKVQPGSRILSDGWRGYRGLEGQGFPHTATPLQGDPKAAHRLFPWVHITLSNLKRFLLGTHHKVEPQHLKRYVAEFNYRLNRRTMETNLFHRLVGACLTTKTIIYKELIALPEQA